MDRILSVQDRRCQWGVIRKAQDGGRQVVRGVEGLGFSEVVDPITYRNAQRSQKLGARGLLTPIR